MPLFVVVLIGRKVYNETTTTSQNLTTRQRRCMILLWCCQSIDLSAKPTYCCNMKHCSYTLTLSHGGGILISFTAMNEIFRRVIELERGADFLTENTSTRPQFH